MKNFKTGAVIVILIIAAEAFYFFLSDRGGFLENRDVVPAPIVLEPRVDEQGSVTVTVTPENILTSESVWNFSIVMDTHSVELNDDLMKSAVLVDDRGKEFQPIAWEGDGPGGHHRSGVLKFKSISPLPKSVEMKIENVGDGIKRSFRWNLSWGKDSSVEKTGRTWYNYIYVQLVSR